VGVNQSTFLFGLEKITTSNPQQLYQHQYHHHHQPTTATISILPQVNYGCAFFFRFWCSLLTREDAEHSK
jgi:hypothetical protein